MTAEGNPHENLRRQDLLTSFKHEPPAPPSVDWGDLIKVSPSQESTPSSTEAPATEPMTRFRTGRILPDVMGGQPAAEQIKLEADERADEDRSTKRSNVKGDARPRQPRAAVRPVAKHLSSSEDTRIGAIPPVPSPEESKPPRANVRPAEGGETASTMMPAGNRIEAVEQHHERAKDKRVLSGAQRRAKRHGLPVPFKRGERWKRHLPQVCW